MSKMSSQFENFESKLNKFAVKNEDLVSEYESALGESIGDDHYELYQAYTALNNISRVDFNQLFKVALSKAIYANMKLVDVVNDMKVEAMINPSGPSNSIQTYFNEVNRIYVQNNNNYDIEYCPENRDKLIGMNLKTVISIAKKYQGLGVDLEDLISAGNVGLCIAFDKYDPTRSQLRNNLLEAAKGLPDMVNVADILEQFQKYLNYGDLYDRLFKHFNKEKQFKRSEVINWVKSNVKCAKFNSVAAMWIRAYILSEIDSKSSIVKKVKDAEPEPIEDDIEVTVANRPRIVYLDAPVGKDSDTVIGEIMVVPDDEVTELETDEAYKIFKRNLNTLLEGVNSRNRGILLKRFGIGLPRPMLPKEIADQEGLSVARISQILQTVIDQMQENRDKYNISSAVMYDALSKII